jgi:hypothetical protein
MDVLLYSKFSNASKKLLSQLQKTPLLLESISLVCIDNKKIREKILHDEKIKVQGVPCFIRLNEETGNFDIFEGHNAFDFFTSMQSTIKENNEKEQRLVEQQQLEQQRMLQQQLEQQRLIEQQQRMLELQMKNEIENENENDNEKPKKKVEFATKEAQRQENERHINQVKQGKEPKEYNRGQDFETLPKTGKLKTSMTFTPIEDLDLDIESEKGISTFIHIDKNEHSDFSEREVSSKQAEQTMKANVGGSLLSKAMKMQKERDSKP